MLEAFLYIWMWIYDLGYGIYDREATIWYLQPGIYDIRPVNVGLFWWPAILREPGREGNNLAVTTGHRFERAPQQRRGDSLSSLSYDAACDIITFSRHSLLRFIVKGAVGIAEQAMGASQRPVAQGSV